MQTNSNNDNPTDVYERADSDRMAAAQNKGGTNIWKYVITILISSMVTFVITVTVGIVGFITLSGGSISLSSSEYSLPVNFENAETREAAAKLSKVYKTISDNYYRELTDKEMIDAMTAGLANGLDSPYTMYFTAEQNEMIEEAFSGEYSGIGAIVAMNQDGMIEITDLIEGGPGLEAGLQIGDIFIAVNGESVTALPDVATLAAMVKGPEGTEVEIEIYRPVERKNIVVISMREKIDNASVRYKMVDESIGYVSISEFSGGTSDHFIKAVDELQLQGAESIIFDLRNNSGGLADEVTHMLDYLLPELTIASFEGRIHGTDFKQTWESNAEIGVPQDMKFVTLVNEFSASASELFAGCLRDYEKSYLIGQQTFGKGSGTITYALDDGSAINVTNFLYYLPNGESIEGVGITPDELVELSTEARLKSIFQLTIEEDTQLAAAIDFLRE